jgi:hypothetical protein
VYVTPAVFGEKLSELEVVFGRKFTKLGECQYMLAKELHLAATSFSALVKELDLVANNVCALAKSIQVVSDFVVEGVESTANFQYKQHEANVQCETAIQGIFATVQRMNTKPSEVPRNSKEDLRDFSAARRRVRDISAVMGSKVRGLLPDGPTPDQQTLIERGVHMIDAAMRMAEDAHSMNLQVSTTRLEDLAVDMEEAAFLLDQ